MVQEMALKEKSKEPEATQIDVGALRKHSNIHGDRQYVCHYENCGKSGKHGHAKAHKQSRPKPNLKLPPSKVPQRKGTTIASAANTNTLKKPWPVKEEMYEEEDSEETEEECDNVEDRWRYRDNGDDDEETEYEG